MCVMKSHFPKQSNIVFSTCACIIQYAYLPHRKPTIENKRLCYYFIARPNIMDLLGSINILYQ